MIELLSDRSYLLAPSSPDDVAAAVSGLEVVRVLRATLGIDSPAERQLYEIASMVSRLAYEFRETLSELDINPILVGDQGCVAVDALIALTPIAGHGDAGHSLLSHHETTPAQEFDEETSQ
jgi:acetyltransferase